MARATMASLFGCFLSFVMVNVVLLTLMDTDRPVRTIHPVSPLATWSVVSFAREGISLQQAYKVDLMDVFRHARYIPARLPQETIFRNELHDPATIDTKKTNIKIHIQKRRGSKNRNIILAYNKTEGKEATIRNEENTRKSIQLEHRATEFNHSVDNTVSEMNKNTQKPNEKTESEIRPSKKEVNTPKASTAVEKWKRILNMPTDGYHSFNTSISDSLPIHRGYPDYRPEGCKYITYDVNKLPKASIIVIFHNEARSTLLRTVHSILDRTPDSLLEELLLVDDASTFPWLHEPLQDYIDHFFKVRLIRLTNRQGLIRARMRGADEAVGEVLVFLDAHTEVGVDWLEPHLTRIKSSRTTLTVPEMDIIKYDSFVIQAPADIYHGSFEWDMTFRYKLYPKYRQEKRSLNIEPMVSPVMVGCAHAIDRDYFYETGAYDLGMNIWGGENIEHSFRLWMCGGRVEILPCSHVGHVFKPKLPYSFGGKADTIIKGNIIRTAEVWMGDYKNNYYALTAELPPIDLDTLAERKKIKEKLKCKSFDWYLKNIIPELVVPPRRAVHFGKVMRADDESKCLDYLQYLKKLVVLDCDDIPDSDEYFMIDRDGNLTYKEKDISRATASKYDKWTWDGTTSQIKTVGHEDCLTYNATNNVVFASNCANDDTNQRWKFRYHFKFDKVHSIYDVVKNATAPPRSSLFFGQLKHIGTSLCLDVQEDYGYKMIPCSQQPRHKQSIHLDRDSRLIHEKYCFRVSVNNDLQIVECGLDDPSKDTIWEYDPRIKFLKVKNKNICLIYNPTIGNKLLYKQCNTKRSFHKWKFSFDFRKRNTTLQHF